MNDEELRVARAIEGARIYANRWSVERWHAYVWMLDELLSGRLRFFTVEHAPKTVRWAGLRFRLLQRL